MAIVFFSGTSLYSQPVEKTWELSLSGNLTSVTSSSNNYSSSSQYLSIYFQPGFFITQNVEIEPEILWLAVDGETGLSSFSANLAYNFGNPPSKNLPFVLVGYGRTNSIPINQTLIIPSSNKHDINILNFGAGMKFFASKSVAFRIEFRHQRYTYSRKSFNTTYDYSTKYTYLLFGFSVFFNPPR